MTRFGRYRIIAPIAEKSSGRRIFRAVLEGESEREVVLKVLPGLAIADESVRARFEHEAELARAIDHPRVVRVLDAGCVGEDLFIATELIDGVPLASVFQRVELSPEVVVGLMVMALDGLGAIHAARDPTHGALLEAVHRDLSPGNLMVDRTGGLKIIDLGLGSSLYKTWRTATGMVFGTPGYIAPEHALGESSGLRADLYAAGVITFELLTGSFYIPRAPMMEMLAAAALKRVVAPSAVKVGVPAALDAVVIAALDVRPEGRFASAGAFAAALVAAVRPAGVEEIARVVFAEADAATRVRGGAARVESLREEAELPAKVLGESQRLREEAELREDEIRASPRGRVRGVRISARVAVAACVIALGVGFLVVLEMTGRRGDAVAVGRVVESAPVVGVRPRAAEVVAPEEPVVVAPVEAAVPAAERAGPAKKKRGAVAAKAAPRVALDFEARLRIFAERAKALKARRPALGAEINRLLAESVMWNYASDPDRAERGLEALERELRAIEGSE